MQQENRIQLGQNQGRKTKPKKVDGEGAKMRLDIELFEARIAQRNANEEPKPLDGPEYMAKIKSEAAENRKKANERNQRRRKVLVETIKEAFLYAQNSLSDGLRDPQLQFHWLRAPLHQHQFENLSDNWSLTHREYEQ